VSRSRPAAGGARWVEVPPERLDRWLAGFADRHGGAYSAARDAGAVVLTAADGTVARADAPFPPLAGDGDDPVADLRAHALRDRTVGVLLVRLGGFAAGVFAGDRLVVSKVDSRPVHGRSAAGGWSQQRFQRRRDGQAAVALRAAADTAARVLLPRAGELDAVVLGGDRRAVEGLRDDRRLAPLFALAVDRFLDVPDPKRAVLEAAPERYRAVLFHLPE
jgi:hypothetical protein